MKPMRHTVVSVGLAVSLTLAVALSGCSSARDYGYGEAPQYASSSAASASNMSATGEGYDMAAVANDQSPSPESGFTGKALSNTAAPGTGPSTTPPADPEQPRKLVRDSNLQLESKEFDPALQSLQEIVQQAGGYIETQSVDGTSLRAQGNYYERSASLTARVPAERLDEVTAKIGGLCNILSQSESVRDISDNYYDAQSRLQVLQVKEARLTELLAKAEKLEDIIQLEDALSTCQYEMDSLTGQLRRMDSQVSYSTLYIQLNEVVEYSDLQPTPKTFGERLGDALGRSWRNLKSSVQNTLIGLIEAGPVVIFYLALWAAVIWLLYRLFFRKRRLAAKRAAAAPAAVPPSATDPITDKDPGDSNG